MVIDFEVVDGVNLIAEERRKIFNRPQNIPDQIISYQSRSVSGVRVIAGGIFMFMKPTNNRERSTVEGKIICHFTRSSGRSLTIFRFVSHSV